MQRLHAAHRTAKHGEQPLDAQMVDQLLLCPDHVADGDGGEIGAPAVARGVRLELQRSGGTHATAEDVRANDEKPVGIERLVRSDNFFPPAGLTGDRVRLSDILVAGQGVADQDRVGPGGVQGAISAVSHGVTVQPDTAFQHDSVIEADMGMLDGGEGGDLVHGGVQIGRRVSTRNGATIVTDRAG